MAPPLARLHLPHAPRASRLAPRVQVMELLFRLLVSGMDADEMVATAESDWERDRKGQLALTRELFMDAIFELIDHWTEGLLPSTRAPSCALC